MKGRAVPESTEKPTPWIKFDRTINAGHLLTFLGMLGVGFTVYSQMDKRVVILEENRKYQTLVDHSQDAQSRVTSDQMTSLLLRVERQVERLNDQLQDDKRERARP
jgi:hemerythrin superfamily protein